ncbi:MAG TPA: hypothetical protein PKE55_10280 [Kiritimatiellia bacterium]|nr:hypothetical protein [Kiritimatiellia bacterium]
MATVLMVVALGGMNLWFGELNQDEGWYLYSARMVAEGQVPYRDFSYTQGPVLPFVYVMSLPFQDAWGVAGGRLFTWLLGIGALGLAAGLAARMTGDGRAALAVAMIGGINVYQSYFTTIVKTYSLCAFMLASGFLVLHRAVTGGGRWGWAGAAVLFGLAVGVRISSLAVFPVVTGYLVWRVYRGAGRWTDVLVFLGAGLATGGLIYLPLLAMGPESFWFHVVEYHSVRSAGGWLPGLIYKAGFISRVVQAYFVAVGLGVGLFLWWRVKGRATEGVAREDKGFAVMAGIAVGAVTLIHFSAPFPYDDYQTPVYPLAVAVLVTGLFRMAAGWHDRSLQGGLALSFLMATAGAWSSPINQSWMIEGRNLIWWQMREEPAMTQLKRVGGWLKEMDGGGTLLTQDIYLAVEAGMRVPRGMEMGPFSFYPDLDRDRAERLGVMNLERMQETIEESDALLAAVSDYGFAIDSPQIVPVAPEIRAGLLTRLERRYERIAEVEGFGQAGTTLRLYRLREEGEGRR